MKKALFDTEEKALSIVIGICLIILLGLTLTGCITKKETYLIILKDQASVKPVCDKKTIYVNRFERQFQQADKLWSEDDTEDVYGLVTFDEGSSIMPLYRGSNYYVMASDGKTFDNISEK